jgi:hypothetical protein
MEQSQESSINPEENKDKNGNGRNRDKFAEKCTCKPNESGHHDRKCGLVKNLLKRRVQVYPIEDEVEGGVIYVVPGTPARLMVEVNGQFAYLG